MIKLIALLKAKPGISREEFKRLWVDNHTKISKQIPGILGYRINIATARQPAAEEIQRGVSLIEALQTRDGVSADVALKCFSLLALNLNEFVYLD